jgi:sigma-B regulation protein RsbU (phosphoserine phosphatase)
LGQVNRLLWKSTASQHFATLFFGIYEDGSRKLRYVNCGHNAPIWLRANGELRRLEATATVIGVFEDWAGAVEEIEMAVGDLLVIFSDGIPEAEHNEEDYGEARLLEELNAHRGAPAEAILDAVLASVQRFSAGTQSDDLTMLVLRAKA